MKVLFNKFHRRTNLMLFLVQEPKNTHSFERVPSIQNPTKKVRTLSFVKQISPQNTADGDGTFDNYFGAQEPEKNTPYFEICHP
jgi:hypothetical protein